MKNICLWVLCPSGEVSHTRTPTSRVHASASLKVRYKEQQHDQMSTSTRDIKRRPLTLYMNRKQSNPCLISNNSELVVIKFKSPQSMFVSLWNLARTWQEEASYSFKLVPCLLLYNHLSHSAQSFGLWQVILLKCKKLLFFKWVFGSPLFFPVHCCRAKSPCDAFSLGD